MLFVPENLSDPFFSDHDFDRPIGDWHRWFAWHPVQTDTGDWCWLRHCERRLMAKPMFFTEQVRIWWQYRNGSR